jgi:hypothetical protein
MFRDVQHLLVHGVEQCDNKIRGSHMMGSSRLKSVQPQLEPIRFRCGALSAMMGTVVPLIIAPIRRNEWNGKRSTCILSSHAWYNIKSIDIVYCASRLETAWFLLARMGWPVAVGCNGL